MENNPVRAGMVKRAWKYPWASAKFHINEQEMNVLVKDGNLLGLVANWREFFQGVDSGGRKGFAARYENGPSIG